MRFHRSAGVIGKVWKSEKGGVGWFRWSTCPECQSAKTTAVFRTQLDEIGKLDTLAASSSIRWSRTFDRPERSKSLESLRLRDNVRASFMIEDTRSRAWYDSLINARLLNVQINFLLFKRRSISSESWGFCSINGSRSSRMSRDNFNWLRRSLYLYKGIFELRKKKQEINLYI